MFVRDIVLLAPSSGSRADEGADEGVKLYPKSELSAKVSPTSVVYRHQNPTDRFFIF